MREPADTGALGDRIDRVVHEPARLRILGYLYVVDSADFLFLMQQTGLTQGNLSSHMSRLERAGYIDVDKTFVDRRPRTLLRLTMRGRAAFETYTAGMKRLLDEIAPKAGLVVPTAGKRKRGIRAALRPRTV
jgi:DNA-binding MarR family transcriptional regulator